MRSIWEALKIGSAKERLAITADLVSIIGVSIASVVATLFATRTAIDATAVVASIVIGLLCLSGATVVLAAWMVVSFYITNIFHEHKSFCSALQFALWSAFAALFILAAYYAFLLLYNMSFHGP